MDRRRSDERRISDRQVDWVEQEGLALPAAQPAMRADEVLVRDDLAVLLVVRADHRQVARVGEPIEPAQAFRGKGSERKQRIETDHPARCEVVLTGPSEGDRPVPGGVGQDEPDAGMVEQPLDQVRVAPVDLLAVDPVVGERQVEQRQVARGAGDEVLILQARRGRLSSSRCSPRDGRPDPAATTDLVEDHPPEAVIFVALDP